MACSHFNGKIYYYNLCKVLYLLKVVFDLIILQLNCSMGILHLVAHLKLSHGTLRSQRLGVLSTPMDDTSWELG